MCPTADISDVPGLAFSTLLRAAKASSLRQLVGFSIVQTLEGLDPNLLSDGRLGELAAALIEPSEALQDETSRDSILRMLPLPKARELAKKLGLHDVGRDIYDRLCSIAGTREHLADLFSFFGVVEDVRAPMDSAPDSELARAGYALFDHQRAVARRALKVLAEPPRKVVLHMPTGAGKTRTAMHIVASHLIVNEPTVVCWLAQNAELLDQAADEFDHAWRALGNRSVNVTRYWSHRTPDILEVKDGFVVAGLAKMAALDKRDPAKLLRFADRVSLTVIDEAHQAIAPTYAAILTALHTKRSRNALLGLTATPGRSWSDIAEDRRLSEYFDGAKVTIEVDGYEDPVSFLIDQKYLARPAFRTLNSEAGLNLSESDVAELAGAIDVPEHILGRLGADTQRNLKIITAIEDLATRHRRILVFAPSVENAKMLVAILNLRRQEAHLVTGRTNAVQRERIIRRFKSNAKQPIVIVNYGVLTTGFDAPATSAAVIARPTMSLVLYSQMVGRATRGTRAGGNEKAEIVTVVDPHLPGFGSIAEAFKNWEDVWNEQDRPG
jgi:DNA repair protein RadD